MKPTLLCFAVLFSLTFSAVAQIPFEGKIVYAQKIKMETGFTQEAIITSYFKGNKVRSDIAYTSGLIWEDGVQPAKGFEKLYKKVMSKVNLMTLEDYDQKKVYSVNGKMGFWNNVDDVTSEVTYLDEHDMIQGYKVQKAEITNVRPGQDPIKMLTYCMTDYSRPNISNGQLTQIPLTAIMMISMGGVETSMKAQIISEEPIDDKMFELPKIKFQEVNAGRTGK